MRIVQSVKRIFKGILWVCLGMLTIGIVGGLTYYIYSALPSSYRSAVTGSTISWNQLPVPVIEKPNWQTFASSRGVNTQLTTDNLSWIGTDGGLIVLDQDGGSVTFHPEHGLPENRITTLEIGGDGRIWVGTPSSGVGVYNGRAWTSHNSRNSTLVSDHINDILVDRSEIVWVATDRGLMRYDGSRWRLVRFALLDISPPPVRQLMQTDSGIWAATEIGLFLFDGNQWEFFGIEDGLINADSVALSQTADDRVWVGSPSGISVFDGVSWDRLTVKDGLQDRPIQSLAAQGNDLFITYAELHLGVIDQYANGVVRSLIQSDLTINQLVFSSAGRSLATNGGLYQLEGADLIKVPLPQNIESRDLTMIAESDGALWIAGDRGLSRYDDRKWQNSNFGDVRAMTHAPDGRLALAFATPADGILLIDGINDRGEHIACRTAGMDVGYLYNAAVGPDGSLWFLGDLAVQRYLDGRWTTHIDGLPSPYVPRKIVTDESGIVWAGMGDGLYRYDETTDRWQFVLPGAVFRMAAGPAGEIWISGEDGIYKWIEGNKVTIPPPPLDNLTRGFVANKRGLWISSEQGIALFGEAGWESFDASHGLPSTTVTALNLDDLNRVWAGFVDERIGFAFFNEETGRWQTVPNIVKYDDPNNGHPPTTRLQDDRVMNVAVTPDNKVWFGTYLGEIGRVAVDELRYRPDDYQLYWRSVRSILIPEDGTIWLAGWEGRLARFLPAEERWEIYDRELSTAAVSDIVMSEGGIWLGADSGVVSIDPRGDGRCHFLPAEDDLNVISAEYDPASGDVWWATDNVGGYLLDVSTGSLDTPILGLQGRHFIDTVLGPDDAIWFLTNQELIRVFDGRQQNIPLPDGFPRVTAVGIGPDFRPWVGTNVGLFFQRGQNWEQITTADGLAGNRVKEIYTAEDGAVWILTDGGASRFTN